MSEVADYSRGEPPPRPGGGPSIHDLVIEELTDRKKFGLRKYGTPLQAWNGRRASRDALDEVLDLAVYLRQMIQEEDGNLLSVVITKDGNRLGKLTISKINEYMDGELADYKVEVAVERGNDVVSVHRRILSSFPRKSLNSIGLLKAALALFDSESLGLEDDFTDDLPLRNEAGSPNMERRLTRVVQAIQAWAGKLRNN